jgi:hypothetical protein
MSSPLPIADETRGCACAFKSGGAIHLYDLIPDDRVPVLDIVDRS